MRSGLLWLAPLTTAALIGAVYALSSGDSLTASSDPELSRSTVLQSRACRQQPPHINGDVQDIRTFDIPAGNLPDTILCLGRQAAISILYSSLDHAQTPAIKGQMSTLDAARILLDATDLEPFPTRANDKFLTLIPKLRQNAARNALASPGRP
jgi:hypothetical protein